MRNTMGMVIGLALLLPAQAALLAQEAGETATAAAARQKLRQAGLSLIAKRWITADEEELRRQLTQWPREEREYFAALQQFRTLQGQFETARGQLQKSRRRLTEVADLLRGSSSGTLEHQQLESESQQVKDQISQAEKVIAGRLDVLDEGSEMTKATVELVNAQNALALRLLGVRRLLGELPGGYRQLSGAQQIQDALAARDAESLGPIENYAAWPRKLERVESRVLADGVPFYRRSGQIRITAILDERFPVTFSYTGASGATLLPTSALAGLEIDLAGAPPGEPVQLEQTSVPTRRIILPHLRLGKYVWQHVPVDVLPAEADYLGARISQQAFGGLQASVEEGKLWLRIKAAAAE